MHIYKKCKNIPGRAENGMQEEHTGGLKTNIQNKIFNFFYIKNKRYEESIVKCYNVIQLSCKSKNLCYDVLYTFLCN